jgi:hypothetical protein
MGVVRRAWSAVMGALLALSGPTAHADSIGDAGLAYETVEPSRIKLGESATLRVTSLDGYLNHVTLPTVAGLEFELVGHSQGVEVANSGSVQVSYILIRVTPQITGTFSIPGLTPNSPSIGLEVVSANAPNPPPMRFPQQTPPPAPMSTAAIPKGIRLQFNGAAFAQLIIPSRPVYVGESVPVDIELGVRPGIVTAMNGLPELKGGEFTLNNLSKQPLRREQLIEGSPFLVMTWHSALAAIKPGEFSVSVETPLAVRIDTRSAAEIAFSSMLGWPFTQIPNSGNAPKDVTIASASSALKVLPLPTEGRPDDFKGAVGEFQVSSDISATHVAAGDPLTLRLHISGVGNFDRVDTPMLEQVEHWKTYPAKASFTPSDPSGTHGEKIFEQPLIAAARGVQSIPGISFSYFDPNTRQYERAETPPIRVMVAGSRAETETAQAGGRSPSAGGLRTDHPPPHTSVHDLRPLYFQARFLVIPLTLVVILAGSGFALRPRPMRATSNSADRSLTQLDAAARSGDVTAFFEVARATLLQTFAARWRMSPEQITSRELTTRLGTAGADIDRLFALAEEARYSVYDRSGADFERWTQLVRAQIAEESR